MRKKVRKIEFLVFRAKKTAHKKWRTKNKKSEALLLENFAFYPYLGFGNQMSSLTFAALPTRSRT